ncbi:MAG: hypothetical protein ACE5HD_07705 [Acidobacteriota bacterium]
MRTNPGRRISPFLRLMMAGLLSSAGLFPSPAPAQALMEILSGSAGHIDTDVFNCGRQGEKRVAKGTANPCDLSYRIYCVDQPDEVNAPARPARGFPTYKPKKQLYLAPGLLTANYPRASSLGPGHVWNLVWDGVQNRDKPDHVGYYGGVSQIVNSGELGNPISANCLPVRGQYACFGKLVAGEAAGIKNTPLGNIRPVGSLSPLPVPLLVRNGVKTVSFAWEEPASQVSRDGAPLPITGYRLFIYPNPVSPPSQADLEASAVAVEKDLPLSTTRLELPRSDAALSKAVTFSAALHLVYSGGLESLYFSANNRPTGVAFADTASTKETDDAAAGTGAVARAIDIEDVFLEIRQKKDPAGADLPLFYATVDLVGEPAGKFLDGTTVKLLIDFNSHGLAEASSEPGKKSSPDVTLEARLHRQGKNPIQADFSGLPHLAAESSLDSTHGRVVFAAPLSDLTGAVNDQKLRSADIGNRQRRVLIWAESRRENDLDRAPNTNDGGPPSVAGEVIPFIF